MTLTVKKMNGNWHTLSLTDPEGLVVAKASHYRHERSARFWPSGSDLKSRGQAIYNLDLDDLVRMMEAQTSDAA